MKSFKEYLLEHHTCDIISHGKITIVTYKNGLFEDYPLSAAVFFGRRGKPESHFKFENEKNRLDFINTKKILEDKRAKQEEEWVEKAAKEAEAFQKDAILVCSWGYGQTNIDFYQVLDRKSKTVTLQQIGSERTHDAIDCGNCVAAPDYKIGEPFKKRISKYGDVNMTSYSSARLWDGKPRYWSSYY